MVSGGTVQADLSSLKNQLNLVSQEVSSLSSAWQGASYDGLSSKCEQFISEYGSALSGEMNAFASACTLYLEYEDAKNELSSVRSQYSIATDDKKSMYYQRITQLESTLSSLKSQIEGYLESASGVHLEASGTSSLSVTTDLSGLTPSFGSLTVQYYTATNGTQLEYLLYVPDYGKEVSGLPVHMYMTGASMNSTGDHIMTDGGIGKLLNEKNINPSGIVIVPYVPSGNEYESETFRSALAELPVAVCEEYNGDKNRISLSGHSYGAITAYNLVNENPNTFSAIVLVSGSKAPTEAFKTVKVWAFHGTQDNPGNNTDYSKAVKNIEAIQAMGGEATLHSYSDYPNCYHTHTGNYTFSNTFEDPDEDKDENISPLEWAFQQRKNEYA